MVGVLFSNRHVSVDGSEPLSGSTLVDELQDLLCDGQSGRRTEGGQLLFLLLLFLLLLIQTEMKRHHEKDAMSV